MGDARGIFVTGTDTGVGKSLVAGALVRLLRKKNIDAVGFKPICTGSENGVWQDAVDLFEASGRSECIDRVCPIRFQAAKAPTIAARDEGRTSDISTCERILAALVAEHSAVVIEGVGGLLVPLDEQHTVADFAKCAGFPVLVVCRAGLGTINHTLLTLNELARRRMRVAGIMMNVTSPKDAIVATETKNEIERISGNGIITIIPFCDAVPQSDVRQTLHAHAVNALKSVDVLGLLDSRRQH